MRRPRVQSPSSPPENSRTYGYHHRSFFCGFYPARAASVTMYAAIWSQTEIIYVTFPFWAPPRRLLFRSSPKNAFPPPVSLDENQVEGKTHGAAFQPFHIPDRPFLLCGLDSLCYIVGMDTLGFCCFQHGIRYGSPSDAVG